MPEKTIEIPVEFKRLFDNDWREAAIWGGRFGLKSHTVARFLLIMARMKKVRIACFREFQNSIAESSHQLLSDLIRQYGLNDFQVTNNAIVNTVNGSDFLFRGLWNNDQSIKSIEGIDFAWVEEAQTVSQKSLEVLTPTVRKDGSKIIYTYNRLMEDDPVHTRIVVDGRPNSLIINVNYDIAIKYGKMPKVIFDEMEDDKLHRPSLFKHKWLGEPYGFERKIYTDWSLIDVIPHEARLWRRGLDFGYSIDPTVLVDIYEYNGGYIIDEKIYQKGLGNKAISDKIANLKEPNTLVIADSAEPKSIDEIASYGINIIGAEKGPGSVLQGIQFVQGQKISVTKTSTKTIEAYRKYLWAVDRSGRTVLVPDDTNHEWSNAMDCLIEGTLIRTDKGEIPIEFISKGDCVYTRAGLKMVTASWKVRDNAKVIKIVLANGNELYGTPNHRIFANGGWKYLRDIRYGDILETWGVVKSFSIGRFGKIIMGRSQANGEGRIRWMSLKNIVRFVRIIFSRLNGNKLHTVPTSVVDRQELEGFSVYDLTIEGKNEYFANGILVHNSIRYGFNGRGSGIRSKMEHYRESSFDRFSPV